MSGKSAISVYHDFPSCQAGISLRSANHKTSGRIDQIFGIFIHKLFRDNLPDDLSDHIFFNRSMVGFRQVLCGNDHRVHPHGLIIFIFNRHLCLPIRSKIWNSSILSYQSKFLCQCMGQINWHWHQFLRFIRSISEYHSLIAGPKFPFFTFPDF